eukprot:scaffold112337_cov69-Phaeocystis_antarctica.AAC.2
MTLQPDVTFCKVCTCNPIRHALRLATVGLSLHAPPSPRTVHAGHGSRSHVHHALCRGPSAQLQNMQLSATGSHPHRLRLTQSAPPYAESHALLHGRGGPFPHLHAAVRWKLPRGQAQPREVRLVRHLVRCQQHHDAGPDRRLQGAR